MTKIRFKGIHPKKSILVDDRKLKSELNGALNKTANLIRGDFGKTTATWTNKPVFKKEGPRGGAVDVFTGNRIYFFLTRGTRSHFVSPKRASALRFKAGYRSKTRVQVIGSRGGGSFGPTAFSKGHRVKGIKARDFDEVIAKRRQKTLDNLIRLAILRSTS